MANDGAASNATGYTRRWVLSGIAIGTGAAVTPGAAGSLVLEVTATGAGGSTVATSAPVTVATPAINAPYIALAVVADEYPPELDIEFDDSVLPDDSIRVQGASDFAFTSLTVNTVRAMTSGELDADEASFGLSSITSPAETYFRARVERGGLISDWSNSVKHGDVTAPVASSASGTAWAHGGKVAVVVTTNEPSTMTVGGTDGGVMEVVSNAALTSHTVRLAGNANSNYDAKTTYAWVITPTDLAGNVGSPLARTETITPAQIAQWSATNGADKSQYLTTADTAVPRLVTRTTASTGGNIQVRALLKATGKRYFEITLTARPTNDRAIIGVDDGSPVIGPTASTTVGGTTGPNGASVYVHNSAGSSAIHAKGTTNLQTAMANGAVVQGDVIGAEFDTVAGTISFFRSRNDGSTWTIVQIGTTVTGCTFMAGGVQAICGAVGNAHILTANFGSTAFVRPLSTGYSAYNA